jgi:hypothetical protein
MPAAPFFRLVFVSIIFKLPGRLDLLPPAHGKNLLEGWQDIVRIEED